MKSTVQSIIINNQFTGPGSSGDIALIKLTSPITYTEYILPVCVPSDTDTFPSGMECWVTGWGNTGTGVTLTYPKTLQQVMVPLITQSSCDTMYHINSLVSASVPIIQDDQICAGYQAGNKDSCQGDSGGPLVCKLGSVWYQVGIVSWGEGCALRNRPGVYTQVSSYLTWLSTYKATRYVPSAASSILTLSALLLGFCLLLHT
ncbi:prostasin-like [Rhinophrynus dorsalis]